MTDIGSTLMAASLIVGMITIPAASQSIDGTQTITEDIPDISEGENIPEKVSTNSSSDSFTREVSTAFQEFRTEISSDVTRISLEDPGSSLNVERRPEQTVWTLESPEGDLEIVRSSSEHTVTVETPQGTLKEERVNGGVNEEFNGVNRHEVEQTKEDLKSVMEEKREQINKRSQETETKQYSQSISLSVQPEGNSEHVAIRNEFSRPINLEDWKLTDRGNYEHRFGDVQIPAGETLYAYYNPEEDVETVDEDAVNVYETGVIFNQGGDEAVVYNAEGVEVARESY